MTPTQLRAYLAVVRLGSVKRAAGELDVTEAAVSLNVGQLRRELGNQLFTRTASGLAFTPGGLRLASRAAEMLGLRDRTILEVSQASGGRRLLRVAASSLFADESIVSRPFLNYQVIVVASPDHPLLASAHLILHQLRDQVWLLGPSAAADVGAVPAMLDRLGIPEDRQQIFQDPARHRRPPSWNGSWRRPVPFRRCCAARA